MYTALTCTVNSVVETLYSMYTALGTQCVFLHCAGSDSYSLLLDLLDCRSLGVVHVHYRALLNMCNIHYRGLLGSGFY